MENFGLDVVKTFKIRCPECLNYMIIKLSNNGKWTGKCSVCKSIIIKQEQSNERLIRIILKQ